MNKLIAAMRMRTDKKVRQFDNEGCGYLATQYRWLQESRFL